MYVTLSRRTVGRPAGVSAQLTLLWTKTCSPTSKRTMPWRRTDLRTKNRFFLMPNMRTMLVIFIVLAVVVVGWLFGAVLMRGYLLH